MLRSLLAASTVLLSAPSARAEAPLDAATLTYLPSRATAALCPAANFFVLEVQIRLGYALFQPSAPNHLTVKVERTNGLFRSTGEMRDDSGKALFSRDYSEIDCGTVLVSMAISVALEFTKLPAEPEPSPPLLLPRAPPPNPPVPVPPLPLTFTTPPLVPERRRFQVGIGSDLSIGLAPIVVGGVGVFLGVRWPNLSLSIEGRALFAPSVTMDQVTVRRGYHATVVAVGAAGCYHPAWAFLCVRVETGSLSFGNPGVENDPVHYSAQAAGFRFGGDRALTPWLAIRLYVQVQAQLSLNTLRDWRDTPILWTQQISGSVGLGSVFTFSEI